MIGLIAELRPKIISFCLFTFADSTRPLHITTAHTILNGELQLLYVLYVCAMPLLARTCVNTKQTCEWTIPIRCVHVCVPLCWYTKIYLSNRPLIQLLYHSRCVCVCDSVHTYMYICVSSSCVLLIRMYMSVIHYTKRLTVSFAFTLARFTVAILKHLNNTLSWLLNTCNACKYIDKIPTLAAVAWMTNANMK